MIGFDELNKTRKEFKKVEDIIKKRNNLKSSYNYAQDINKKYMSQINNLIGKSLNQSTKANIHTWEWTNEYDGSKSNYTLEISRKGIGATSPNRYQIETYDRLFNSNNRYDSASNGLIKDVIDDEEVFKKTLEYLNPKGKEIMNIIKEVRQQTKISLPEPTTIQKLFTLSNEEKEFFKVATNEAIIEIKDSSGRRVDFTISVVKENHDDIDKKSLFVLHDLDINKEEDFVYIIFANNHLKDFENAMNEYSEKIKINQKVWETFDEIIRERLAKYILLGRI